jgi:predicted transcriptional regulator
MRRIVKDLSLAVGDVQYHLNFLENNGCIKSRKFGNYKTFYSMDVTDIRHELTLAVLHQETLREIILYLIEHPAATQGHIATQVGFTSPTVNAHMSRLIEMDLVKSFKDGKFVKYVVLGDIRDIVRSLEFCYPSIWARLSDRLANLFLDLSAGYREKEEEKNDV